MLVLNSKAGDSINIGKNVRVRVVDVQGDRVKIRVSAPMKTLIDKKTDRRIRLTKGC